MIRHAVMFKFKPEVSGQQRFEFVQMLHQLANDIDVIRALEIGQNVVPSARACDLLLMVDVEDEEALHEYGDHPLHQPVKQTAAMICSESRVVDYVIPG